MTFKLVQWPWTNPADSSNIITCKLGVEALSKSLWVCDRWHNLNLYLPFGPNHQFNSVLSQINNRPQISRSESHLWWHPIPFLVYVVQTLAFPTCISQGSWLRMIPLESKPEKVTATIDAWIVVGCPLKSPKLGHNEQPREWPTSQHDVCSTIKAVMHWKAMTTALGDAAANFMGNNDNDPIILQPKLSGTFGTILLGPGFIPLCPTLPSQNLGHGWRVWDIWEYLGAFWSIPVKASWFYWGNPLIHIAL